MTILLYLILLGGLLVFLSQSSYAYVIAKVEVSTSERRVHCAHHTVHSVCGILVMLLAIALLKGDCQPLINVVCAIAAALLVADAVVFLILNRVKHFALRRDEIMTKWKGEKVFGPEHDREVSEYRVLKEITNKNLLRDGLHLILFVALYVISLL
jgi:hypothetical protein